MARPRVPSLSRHLVAALPMAALLFSVACTDAADGISAPDPGGDRIVVATTFSILAELVERIGGGSGWRW